MRLTVFVTVNFMAAVTLYCNFAIGFNRGYKRGQIDALSGTVNYELVVRPDSTREWVKK
jgi:hypothetical protein